MKIEIELNEWEILHAEKKLSDVMDDLNRKWCDEPNKRAYYEQTRTSLMKIYEALIKAERQEAR